MYQNLHMHTTRCHHASGTEEEYVLKAIEAGMTHIGFADHCPLFRSFHGDNDGLHWFRMSMEELPGYVETLTRLREKYKDVIEIRIGLEGEYYRRIHGDLMKAYRDAGVEYLGLAGHMIWEGELECGWPKREVTEADLREYVDSLLEGAATGDFLFVAHPDLIRYPREDDLYWSEMTRLIAGLKETGIPLEINLAGLQGGRWYPKEAFWKIVGEYGNPVILNSDAHKPEGVWDKPTYDRAMEMVEKYSLNFKSRILY